MIRLEITASFENSKLVLVVLIEACVLSLDGWEIGQCVRHAWVLLCTNPASALIFEFDSNYSVCH